MPARPLILAGAAIALMAVPAAGFAAPSITGNGGVVAVPDGSVAASPTGNKTVTYVSTNGGIMGVGANPDGSSFAPTDGSTFRTATFTPGAGGALSFYFDFVSSDGSDGTAYADNSWADLINATSNAIVAVLYTSATTSFTPLPGTAASVLGSWSGQCYGQGCGNTGWKSASYHFNDNKSYYLEFGVVNSIDTAYDSALYFDGAVVNGKPIIPAAEPGYVALVGFGLLGTVAVTRRRR